MKGVRITKWIIYILGAVALYSFISVRYLPLLNLSLKEKLSYWDDTKYGELYYFSMITHFRENDLPPFSPKFEHSSKHAPVNEAEVLTFGDSFFEFSRIKQFPERIADDFNKKVHYVNSDLPLEYLVKNHYTDTMPKLVIFERVERYIPVTFQHKHKYPALPDSVPVSGLQRAFHYVSNKIFYKKSEELYDLMLKRSSLSTSAYSLISTVKLDLFGYITEMTPVYKVDGDSSWVFYHDQVNGERTSYYYQFTQMQIDSICDNMADLAVQLKADFNMDVVYLPLPARYTVYHDELNNDPYNNFIPRLYDGLEKRGVKFVKVFDEYINSPQYLYFRTDEHWNQGGFDIAYNKTIDYIKNDPQLKSYLLKNAE